MQSLTDDVAQDRARPASLSRAESEARAERLRSLAGARPYLRAALLAVPLASVLVMDVARRGQRILEFDGYYPFTYALSMLESVLVWGTLLFAACRRRGAARHVYSVLFVVFFTLAIGGQRYFHDQYNAYLNVDVSLFASNLMDSVVNQLFADIGNYALAKLPPLAVSLTLLFVARRVFRPTRKWANVARVLAPVFFVAALFLPSQHRHAQASTPDVLYLGAAGGLLRTQLGLTDESSKLRPRARESLPVVLTGPPVTGKRPNVVLFLMESVRADAVCITAGSDCKRTPYSDKAVPNRFPLLQMRSLDSSTAISLAVLWSGVGPNESRDVLHTWPLVFDYARAAGYDTAYWTSQNMMFGNARLWVKNLGVTSFLSATDLDPVSDLDMGAPEGELADRVKESFGKLREPFLAVVQLSNMHYPYMVDPKGPAPFQPALHSKAPEDNQEFQNHYMNGVHQEDRHVAAMLTAIRKSELSERTVILYTSDHGEAFREHGQMGHTFSVLDEEVHVPAWVDAPDGLLTEAQVRNLAAKKHAFTFHVDVTATMLDLMGVWDDPGIAKYREKMLGTSLLREGANERALPMTNCAGVWSCAFENWGYMQKNMKLEARAWDKNWHCYDLAEDPYETARLPDSACGDLKALSLATFQRLPGGEREQPTK